MPVPNIRLADKGVRKSAGTAPLISTAVDLRDGSRDVSETATQFYELSFSGGTPNNIGSGNAHSGGGYIDFLANPENGAGTGINDTNIFADTVNDDPIFTGTIDVLRDTYFAGGTAYSFGNQTLFLSHPETQKFYMRMRIKFSSNWQWGNDQLKFCKNKGPGQLSTNCPKFRSTAGRMYITKLDPGGANEQSVYPGDPSVFGESTSAYHIQDDIVNDFGGVGADGVFVPTNNQWYWFEWEIDCGTGGNSDGSYRIWIDGEPYMGLDNVPVRRVTDGAFDSHELGHVWQNGSPTENISMYWHSISIWDQRPTNLPTGIA